MVYLDVIDLVIVFDKIGLINFFLKYNVIFRYFGILVVYLNLYI